MRMIQSTILLSRRRHPQIGSSQRLEPAQKPKCIAGIYQWVTAFQTFEAIYTAKFPNDAPALMKYSETVQDLASKNAHWRFWVA